MSSVAFITFTSYYCFNVSCYNLQLFCKLSDEADFKKKTSIKKKKKREYKEDTYLTIMLKGQA